MTDDAEALRRRLYSAGATDADVAAYRERAAEPVLVAAPADPPSADAVDAAPPPPRPGPRRRLLVLGGVLVLALVVTLVLVLRPPVQDRRALTVLPAEPDTTAEMIRNLRIGKDAGIAAYLVTHQGPAAIRSSPGYWTSEVRGKGGGTARIEGPPGDGAGRATVLLVLSDDADVTWQAEGLGSVDGGAIALHALRGRATHQDAGALTADTFRYRASDRPVRLRVIVPDGVAWGAAVVFTE